MLSIAVFLTATSLALVAPPAHGDEGIRFVCEREQIPVIQAAMASYLKAMAIPAGLVVTRERPAQGVLVYTLATPANDTSTLDLASRIGVDISAERIGQALDSAQATTTVSRKEIVLAMLQHGRLTELRGGACSVESLSDHVALRQNIVAWAENLRWSWPNGGPAEWNRAYWNRGTPRRDVSLREAIDDVFANQRAYAIGCYTATKLVFVKGVLDYYDRIRESATLASAIQARLLSDGEPLSDIEPGNAWSFEPGFDPKESIRPGKLLSIIHTVAPKNFVPGDWVYFLNTDPLSSKKTGYEGSNAIYLGGGRFDDYYGENNHAFTYEEKLDEVFQWRNGVFSRKRDAGKRRPLSALAYERLGTSPSQGGIVKTWRMAPDLFERRATVSRTRSVPSRSKPLRVSATSLARMIC